VAASGNQAVKGKNKTQPVLSRETSPAQSTQKMVFLNNDFGGNNEKAYSGIRADGFFE
jgi:hypothetical protein